MIVYMLVNKNTNDFYIGSTRNLFNRICGYREEYMKGGSRKVIQRVMETGGWKDWSFIVIDKVEETDKEGLLRAEFKLIKSLNPNLNVVRNTKYLKGRTIYLDI